MSQTGTGSVIGGYLDMVFLLGKNAIMWVDDWYITYNDDYHLWETGRSGTEEREFHEMLHEAAAWVRERVEGGTNE